MTVNHLEMGTNTIPRQYTSEGRQCQIYVIDI